MWSPCLVKASSPAGEVSVRVGHPLVDEYLRFLAGRARPNSLLAAAFDLKVFFAWSGKDPAAVVTKDVIAFLADQRAPRPGVRVVRLSDGGSGLSARTVARRLSSLSGLYAYLLARGDVGVTANPVPRGLATRRARRNGSRAAPLVRPTRLLPRILEPEEVNRLVAALRTYRDRAMVEAMVLGGLRRCEVLGLRLKDLEVGPRKVFIVEGKGGHQRKIPVSPRFFTSVAAYLDNERPSTDTDRVFVVLKGPRRGQPLSPAGLDQILESARDRAGLAHATCHELRHTCMTRLREAGMALETVQAQAGHRSIETTRLYLNPRDRTVADEYFAVTEKVEALYGQTELPAEAEGPNMARLRREHHRMLGNGYCARPVELDCAFETICETCTYFATTIEFRPTLRRQLKDARKKQQTGREQLYQRLLDDLEPENH